MIANIYTNAMAEDSTNKLVAVETQATYESLTPSQQQFIDGFINNLNYKMNYQTDVYYIQDIITDLTKLQKTQPKLKNIITVTIDRLKSNYTTELASLADQNDGLDLIRSITANRQYLMSKKQFIKNFKEKALAKINTYANSQEKQNIAWQIKNQIEWLSGALTKQETNELKEHIDQTVSPSSWINYNTALLSLDNIYPWYNTIGLKFAQWTIKDGDFSYTISSKQVEYSGSVILDLFTNPIYRLNANINFNMLSETNIKSTITNGKIIQVMATVTNHSSSIQPLPIGNPILKDSQGMQHGWGGYYSSSYNFIKPQETITVPYYFIIDKGANVEYIAYQWPFTSSQWIYLIETK